MVPHPRRSYCDLGWVLQRVPEKSLGSKPLRRPPDFAILLQDLGRACASAVTAIVRTCGNVAGVDLVFLRSPAFHGTSGRARRWFIGIAVGTGVGFA